MLLPIVTLFLEHYHLGHIAQPVIQMDLLHSQIRFALALLRRDKSLGPVLTIIDSSLTYLAMETQHDVFWSFVLNRDLAGEEEEKEYQANFLVAAVTFQCPVDGCAGQAKTKWNLRRHFQLRHTSHFVSFPEEGVYDKCGLCHMREPFGPRPQADTTMQGWVQEEDAT